MHKYLALILGVPLSLAVNHWYGPIGVTRLFGVLFVLAGICCCFVGELPVHFGRFEVARLRGMSKAWVIVPLISLGIAAVIYAPSLTCISYKYRQLCQQSG